MNMLFRITYAAYAKGTHHKLALDAVQNLKGRDADAWQRFFIKHAKVFVEGSKAPDDDFKDFTNHVLHTRDGLWGGAPDKARTWYDHFVDALAASDWPTAAYCAGVLSHYYTDVLMPFHTGQSEAENNIHRATEWSINRSYDDLRVQGEQEWCLPPFELPTGENWLVELVVANARMANASYEKLIAHYDIKRGVVDPPSGLDYVGRRVVSELLRYAYLTFADVLARAIADAKVAPPDISLTGPMLLAAINIPVNQLVKRIEDVQERRLVQAMYDELNATGTVEVHLPEDDRAVREAHAREVLAKRPPEVAASKVFPFKPRDAAAGRPAPRGAVPRTDANNVVSLRPAAAAKPGETPRILPPLQPPAGLAQQVEPGTVEASPPLISLVPQPARAETLTALSQAVTTPSRVEPTRAKSEATTPTKEPRFYLSLDQDVVDAPSIGPKTAERLYAHDIRTVRDLMKADVAALATLLDVRHIDAGTLTDWQHQARLVCTVPGLRGTHAQLLVGAGYRTADAVAQADPDRFCADVLAFAKSSDGQRILRNGEPPDVEKIKGWLAAARSTIAA